MDNIKVMTPEEELIFKTEMIEKYRCEIDELQSKNYELTENVNFYKRIIAKIIS